MKLKTRRVSVMVLALIGVVIWLVVNPASYEAVLTPVEDTGAESTMDYGAEAITVPKVGAPLASEILEQIEVKGRAPKTGYETNSDRSHEHTLRIEAEVLGGRRWAGLMFYILRPPMP